MAEIKLVTGEIALVDDDDFEWLNQLKWYLSTDGYAMTSRPTRYMARMIMKTPKGQECDHKHHVKLDNRKSELRNGTKAHNQRNRLPNLSKTIKGVVWEADRGKWKAQIRVSPRTITLGRYDSPTEAATAYNSAAVHYFGEHACLNQL